jgi:hypothetical protein
MKKVFILFFVFTQIGILNAQNCTLYYPEETGTKLKYTTYDAKDRVTASSTQHIKDLYENEGVLSILIETQSFDKKGKDLGTNEYNAICENGVFKVDMKSFMDAATMAAYEDSEVEISGNNLEIPANLSVGDELPDGRLNISIYSSGTRIMGMSTALTDRKVEAKEEVTTEAGTFECYKISYTMTVSTMFSVKVEAIDWISEGVGTVKSETYSRGKLMGYTLLTGLE